MFLNKTENNITKKYDNKLIIKYKDSKLFYSFVY